MLKLVSWLYYLLLFQIFYDKSNILLKADTVQPVLITFSYDANYGLLNLTFSKVISVRGFSLLGLQAQSQTDVTVIGKTL
jgi:hypothetical protein